MKWHWSAALTTATILGVLGPAATAGAQSTSEHSDNVSWIANWNNHADYQGSDQAFWGDRDVLGQYASPGGFQLMNIADPAHPRPEGLFERAFQLQDGERRVRGIGRQYRGAAGETSLRNQRCFAGVARCQAAVTSGRARNGP